MPDALSNRIKTKKWEDKNREWVRQRKREYMRNQRAKMKAARCEKG